MAVKKWTDDKISILKKIYPHETNREIQKRDDFRYFTINELTKKAFDLKVKKTKETMSRALSEAHIGQKPWNKNLRKLDKELENIVCSMYLSGASTISIGKHFSVSWATIRNILIRNDIKLRIASERMAGENNPMYGKKRPDITGSNCHFWKGGMSYEPYGPEFNNERKEFIRELYNYRCQYCFRHQTEFDVKLSIHHIDYNKKNNKINNLIPLCINCHSKTNSNRKYWIVYFSKIVKD